MSDSSPFHNLKQISNLYLPQLLSLYSSANHQKDFYFSESALVFSQSLYRRDRADKRKQKRHTIVMPNAVHFLKLSVCRIFRLETYWKRNLGLKGGGMAIT